MLALPGCRSDTVHLGRFAALYEREGWVKGRERETGGKREGVSELVSSQRQEGGGGREKGRGEGDLTRGLTAAGTRPLLSACNSSPAKIATLWREGERERERGREGGREGRKEGGGKWARGGVGEGEGGGESARARCSAVATPLLLR
jgi:hypothetical protein